MHKDDSDASDAATAPAEAAGTETSKIPFESNSLVAGQAIEKIMEERDFPTSPKAAARAGWEACNRTNYYATPQPAINVPEGWIPVEERLPVVELGQELHCFVAAKRKHNDKVYVLDLWYVNRPDSEDNPNGIEGEDGEKLNCVGWFNIGCNSGYDEFYMPADNESEIFAWQPIALPAAPSAPAVGDGQ